MYMPGVGTDLRLVVRLAMPQYVIVYILIFLRILMSLPRTDQILKPRFLSASAI